MKSRLTFNLLLVFLFSFFACKKEGSKEDGNGTGPQKGDFYATIDGNQWNADSIQLILVSSDGISITGISKTGEQISIELPEFKTGTYTLGAQSLSYAISANLLTNVSNVYVSNSGTAGGTVIITSIDSVSHLVSGTFELTLKNPADNSTKTITNGIFNYIPYSGGAGGPGNPPPGNEVDTLKATIDGVVFNSAQVLASVTSGQLLLAGFSASGTQDIGLLMPSDIKAGSYPLDFATGLYIGIYNPSPSVTLVSQASGTLTILSNDVVAKRIIGTFDFTASPTGSGTPSVITNGYFAISY